MKKNIFIVFAVVCVMASCDRRSQCILFVPDDSQLSWTEYNTVAEYYDFFQCHPMAAKIHNGDTIRVCGWIVWDAGGRFLRPHPNLPEPYHRIIISDSPSDDGGPYKWAALRNRDSVFIPESLWHKKLYVKGRIVYDEAAEEEIDCCNYYIATIDMIQVDSIPIE